MSFRAAPQYVLVMECSLDILPVPNKICPAVLYCAVTSFPLLPDPGQGLFLEPTFCAPFFIQRIPCYLVDVFHQIKPVRHKLTFTHIIGNCPDPVPSVAVDINAFQYIRIIVLPDISIYRFPQGHILIRSRIKSSKIEWRDQLSPAITDLFISFKEIHQLVDKTYLFFSIFLPVDMVLIRFDIEVFTDFLFLW